MHPEIDPLPLCAAKTRAGTPCRRVAGKNGRCCLHGGRSTGPKDQRGNQNALKHGIFSRQLDATDLDVYHHTEVGNVDVEIRLVRVMICRNLRQLSAVEADPTSLQNVAELIAAEIKRQTGIAPNARIHTEVHLKRPDGNLRLLNWIGRLVQLERLRAEHLGGDEESPDALRKAILADIKEIDRLTGRGKTDGEKITA